MQLRSNILENASISPSAKIGENVTVGAFAVIEDDVVIGDNCWIAPHAILMNGTRIGNNCKIFPGAVLGAIPQDLKFEGENSELVLGNNVVVREYCTLNRGTKYNHRTEIHDNCLIMAYVHLGHDCIIHKNAILVNNVNLAGHVEVGESAIIGGMAAIHQFVKIGDHAMVSGGSLVRKDVPPYVKAGREPLSFIGVNSLGLKRRGFSTEQIREIQEIYRILFVRGYNTTQAIDIIESTINASEFREKILGFLANADRGIMKGFKGL